LKRISVCMIVRNEEAMLAGCLGSVRGLAHEIIVVDTGSTDRTVEIARRARARVVQIPWEDDFAAARNASLSLARGDWILILDADERLGKGAGAAVRKAIADATFDCGMLPMHEATRPDAPLAEVLSGKERAGEINYLPRLLRRTEDLRFEGIIHESVLPWLRARGMRVGFVEAPIVHLGAARDVRQARGKAARNVALLEKAVAARPDDPMLHGYLAYEHLEAGREAEARAAVERGWALVERTAEGGLGSVLRLATARARLALTAGDTRGVLATVDRAEAVEGGHPDLDFLRGSALELDALAARRGEDRARLFDAALASYRAALDKREHRYAQAFVIGATGFAGLTRVGCALLARRRFAEARAAFAEALAARPDHAEAAFGMAECHLEAGEHEAALATLAPHLGARADGWLLGAAAMEQLGLLDDFRLFLARARERAAQGYLSPHRRERHAALHGALAAYLGTPMAVPGPRGALFALLAREPLPHPEGAPYEVDDKQLRTLLKNLLGIARLDLASALLEPRAEQVAPGLAAAVGAALVDLGLSVADDGEPSYTFVGALGSSELATLRGLLAAHPELSVVDAAGEEGLGSLLAGDADAAAVRAWLAARAPEKRRAVFVVDGALLHLERAARLLPAARFVLLARDVRALVGARAADLLGEPGDPAERAVRWSALVRGIREQAAAAPGRYLELRYEDLLADPPAVVRRLLAFLGEPEDARVLRHLIDAYPGRHDKWRRELGPESRARVEAAARETLSTLGYEVTS
jgi:tetratricopeptide (TPR) repeat protein